MIRFIRVFAVAALMAAGTLVPARAQSAPSPRVSVAVAPASGAAEAPSAVLETSPGLRAAAMEDARAAADLLFDRMDQKHDGAVTFAEWKAASLASAFRRVAVLKAAAESGRLDARGLNLYEIAQHEADSSPDVDAALRREFDAIDLAHRGVIDRAEFEAAVLRRLGG